MLPRIRTKDLQTISMNRNVSEAVRRRLSASRKRAPVSECGGERVCGFAALQCGKAMPYRKASKLNSRLRLRESDGGAASEKSGGPR